jgi:hypothetical protein
MLCIILRGSERSTCSAVERAWREQACACFALSSHESACFASSSKLLACTLRFPPAAEGVAQGDSTHAQNVPQRREGNVTAPVQRTRQARACAGQSGGCTHGGAGARRDVARAYGGGGEHTSCGAWPSSTTARLPTADAGSAGRGRGLDALPRPSQCRPAAALPRWLNIGTRTAARRRGPAHAL